MDHGWADVSKNDAPPCLDWSLVEVTGLLQSVRPLVGKKQGCSYVGYGGKAHRQLAVVVVVSADVAWTQWWMYGSRLQDNIQVQAGAQAWSLEMWWRHAACLAAMVNLGKLLTVDVCWSPGRADLDGIAPVPAFHGFNLDYVLFSRSMSGCAVDKIGKGNVVFACWSPGEPMPDGVAPVPAFNGLDLDYFFLDHVVVPAFLKPKSPKGCRMSLCATEPWLTEEHMLKRGQTD